MTDTPHPATPTTEAIAALKSFLSSDTETRRTVLALRPDLRERLESHVRKWLARAASQEDDPVTIAERHDDAVNGRAVSQELPGTAAPDGKQEPYEPNTETAPTE